MPKSPSSLLVTPEFRACTECRKRKSKCSGTAPCQYCSRNKKPCVFNRAPSRTPLTRKNLDDAEHRCTKLAGLLQRLNPDIDIEDALKMVASPGSRSPRSSLDRLQSVETHREASEEPDRFAWNEVSALSTPRRGQRRADGMASLPTEKSDSGYLGISSGSNILRTISSLLPEPTDPDATQQDRTEDSQLESPRIPDQMSDAVVLDALIDAYFTHYHTSYPILHESTFRRKYRRRRETHVHLSWHPIFYLVLAIGDWILSGGSGPGQSRYYAAARSRMSMRMLESGNLLTVQAFLLMGNYLQKRDRPNTGYNFIGIAYRMALGLGLHRELPAESTADTLLNERRRVVWWILYCFDSGFSITTGRPIMASDSFIETRLPRNIDDSECELTSVLPAPINEPTIYSSIIAQSRLASIGNMIYRDVISAPNNQSNNLRTSRSLDHQLKAWKLSLPVYFTARDIPTWFRGPRAIIGWKEQNLRMMLWWGSQRVCNLSSDSEEAQNMCQYTAVETIQDIATFCTDHPDAIHAGLAWYATYFLFQAIIVLSIHQFKPRHAMDIGLGATDQDLWVFSISKARDCLTQLGRNNTAATRCLEVLDRIWSQCQSQPAQSLSSPVNTVNTDRDPGSGSAQSYHPLDETAINTTAYAVDPALQIFLNGTSWNNNIFEGLQGFPSTVEIDSFDYVPTSTLGAGNGQGWPIFSDSPT